MSNENMNKVWKIKKGNLSICLSFYHTCLSAHPTCLSIYSTCISVHVPLPIYLSTPYLYITYMSVLSIHLPNLHICLPSHLPLPD